MIKLIAVIALVIALYFCVKYMQRGSGVSKATAIDTPALYLSKLRARQEIYVPVNLESATRNGHRNIRTILKIRNTSSADSAYLTRIDYYDAEGMLLKKFLESALLLKPMATKEVMVKNNEFATKGDNFLVHWHSNNPDHRAFVQSVSLDDANRVVTIEHGIIVENAVEQ